MSFTTKYIEVDFSLAHGVFAGGGNTYTAKGCRISAQITKAGGLSFGEALISIYGLPLSVMNQLGTFGQTLTVIGRNTVTVKAGDDPSNLATVYTGDIQNAYTDGWSQPNVPFRVEARVAAYVGVKPIPPLSHPGSQDVAEMLGQVAQSAGWQIEDNGVACKIMNPYFPGTATQQLLKIVDAARIEHIVDNGTLAIWNPGQARQGAATPISPETGLVGYPRFNSLGIDIVTLWQPTLAYGQNIQVQSSITPACGTWNIHYLEYDLECETPNGRWFCNVMAHPLGSMVTF